MIDCETIYSHNTIIYEIYLKNWHFKANGWSILKLDIDMKLAHAFVYVIYYVIQLQITNTYLVK